MYGRYATSQSFYIVTSSNDWKGSRFPNIMVPTPSDPCRHAIQDCESTKHGQHVYRQTLVNQHCTVKSHVAGRGLLLSPPPTSAKSVLVVPDHLVKELLGTLGLALGRHRRHFDGAS